MSEGTEFASGVTKPDWPMEIEIALNPVKEISTRTFLQNLYTNFSIYVGRHDGLVGGLNIIPSPRFVHEYIEQRKEGAYGPATHNKYSKRLCQLVDQAYKLSITLKPVLKKIHKQEVVPTDPVLIQYIKRWLRQLT
jgi:hypothetical protein